MSVSLVELQEYAWGGDVSKSAKDVAARAGMRAAAPFIAAGNYGRYAGEEVARGVRAIPGAVNDAYRTAASETRMFGRDIRSGYREGKTGVRQGFTRNNVTEGPYPKYKRKTKQHAKGAYVDPMKTRAAIHVGRNSGKYALGTGAVGGGGLTAGGLYGYDRYQNR